jgi:hypothetical protein
VRLGREQPRIFTPPLRELTPSTSLGFSVIEFADDILGFHLLPWQKWLLIHMLELLPDNRLRFKYVVVLIARQNGKSTLSVVLALWFMYVYGSRLILGTAQDLDTAEEVWQKAVDLVTELDEDDEPVRPEMYDLHSKVVLVNGKKSLELKTGERYKVKAANRRAGRGLSGDLINLDELREHQTWDAWAAVTKTTIARDHALILAWSNAGDASSLVLRYLRRMAHLTLGDPDGINSDGAADRLLDDEDLAVDDAEDTLAIFEWSAAPGCDVNDRDGWAQANPSLGYTITERTLASARRTDPDWVFRTECLCQWSDDTLDGPFPPGTWESCRDNTSSVVADSKVWACVDVSWDRSDAHIAIAGWTPDGSPHAEVVASRAGTAWVAGWFNDPAHPLRAKWPIVVQATGAPSSSLIMPLTEAGLTVEEWKGTDLGKACGAFYDLVRSSKLRHLTQPVLDIAASTAYTRPLGDAWVWDRKHSPHDVAPLVAVTGAIWGLSQPVHEIPTPPPPVVLTGAAGESWLTESF